MPAAHAACLDGPLPGAPSAQREGEMPPSSSCQQLARSLDSLSSCTRPAGTSTLTPNIPGPAHSLPPPCTPSQETMLYPRATVGTFPLVFTLLALQPVTNTDHRRTADRPLSAPKPEGLRSSEAPPSSWQQSHTRGSSEESTGGRLLGEHVRRRCSRSHSLCCFSFV